jgi:hypothetical protein
MGSSRPRLLQLERNCVRDGDTFWLRSSAWRAEALPRHLELDPAFDQVGARAGCRYPVIERIRLLVARPRIEAQFGHESRVGLALETCDLEPLPVDDPDRQAAGSAARDKDECRVGAGIAYAQHQRDRIAYAMGLRIDMKRPGYSHDLTSKAT